MRAAVVKNDLRSFRQEINFRDMHHSRHLSLTWLRLARGLYLSCKIRSSRPIARANKVRQMLNTRRGRLLVENLTAYLFLAPAGALILLFGLFPVAFAFFVSLHRWRRFPDSYIGLANYEKALGNLGYILFFWLALLSFAAALRILRQLAKAMRQSTITQESVPLLAGVVSGYAALLAIDWFFKLIPVIMLIPRQVRGQNVSLALFMEKFGESFTSPGVHEAGNLMLVGFLAAGGALALVAWRFRTDSSAEVVVRGGLATATLLAAVFLLRLTIDETNLAIATARESGESLPIWSQLVFVSAGIALIAAAYLIFQRGIRAQSNRRFALLVLSGLALAVGGYLLMAEAPAALSAADDDLLAGFWVTVMYAGGTVPVQLTIGLLLAYLLFQPIRFRSFFRMVYFIPYITPFVATSIVFRIIFDAGKTAPANRMLAIVGIEPQRWILERSSIGSLLGLPDFLAGPGAGADRHHDLLHLDLHRLRRRDLPGRPGQYLRRALRSRAHRRRQRLAHFPPHHPAPALAHHILPIAGGGHRHLPGLYANLDIAYRRGRQQGQYRQRLHI